MVRQFVEAEPATIGGLLTVAVQLEAAARQFYEGLAERCAWCPEVAKFWQIMAADEACHENRLIEWRASLNEERLLQPVDPRMLETGRTLLATTVEELLVEIRNLDDAYETAHDLESSEINAIFGFFIRQFAREPRVAAMLMQELDEHAERLMTGFPARYATKAARRGMLC
jgi:rubrerythrin